MNNICTFLSAVGTDEENQERDEKTRLVLFFWHNWQWLDTQGTATNNMCTFFKRTWQWGSGPGPRCQERGA